VKFWLNVSRKEQKKRFMERLEKDEKNWKFRLGDLDDRERWDDYQAAYEEALRETSREWAPWYAIPADDKSYTRVAVARVMVETLKKLNPRFPKLGAEQRRELQDRSACRRNDPAAHPGPQRACVTASWWPRPALRQSSMANTNPSALDRKK
jgi:hypothetical protein